MAIDDIYPNDFLSQYLSGPTNQPDVMGPAPGQEQQPLLNSLVSPQTPQQQQQPMSDDAPINVQGFQPHHRTTLGTVADIGLALLGLPIAPFKRKAQRENMRDIMQGFTSDPIGSIQRMAQVPGMEDKAWQLFEHYQQLHSDDDVHQQRLEYYKTLNEDHARSTLSSYLGAIGSGKDPEGTYKKLLPMLRTYAGQKNLPNDLLSDDWNPELAHAVTRSGIKPEDQERLDETAGYHRTQSALRMDEIIQSRDYKNARLDQMDQRNSEGIRHNKQMETIAQERANRTKKYGSSYKMTKYGPAEVSPDGNSLAVTKDNVIHIYAKSGPDQWRFVKSKPVPKNEQMPDPEADNDEDD